jgi:tetrapyrrole methylase family protein / MazG family protein
MSHFTHLVEIMEHLRGANGCPWDKEQTHESLKPYLIEEAYELIDAIDSGVDADTADELGDVLLQVVFHAQIAAEENRFTIEDVSKAIADKLIRRHPHVFGEVQVETADQVVENWQVIKSREKAEKEETGSALSGVPRHLPALLRAFQIQKKAARVGFDWEQTDEVIAKVMEEVTELQRAETQREKEEEFGDLLFSLVNLARFLKIDPEAALGQTVSKFQSRFEFIERELEKRNKMPQDATLPEMDALWEQAKKAGGGMR